MKKILFTMVLSAIAMNCDAQLVVDSIGHVGIGTETPWREPLLSVGKSGGGLNAAIQCSDQGRLYGTYVMNHNNAEYNIYGIFANVMNTQASSTGGRAESWGCNDATKPFHAIGMVGAAGRARSAAGILGRRVVSEDITVNYAGIYGSVYSTNNLVFGNYSGSYAGFFNGMVRVTDGIYATLLSPAASASPSGQEGLTILSDRCESVTDKLSQVQTLQILRQRFANNESEKVEEEEEEEEIKSHLSPIQYGLDANQLKEVYPELVYEDANGNVSINYVEMVPLLVQSIKELKKELAELKGTSPKNAKAISETTAIEETASDIDMVRMDQNKPNPFSESTVIALNIPQEAQTANIYIYDMSGKQVQSLPVTERGETDITVYARNLTAGMYIYTLVVDSKVCVTRRMIISE